MISVMNVKRQLTELVVQHNNRFDVADDNMNVLIARLHEYVVRQCQENDMRARQQERRYKINT
jgi:hypothetical protein